MVQMSVFQNKLFVMISPTQFINDCQILVADVYLYLLTDTGSDMNNLLDDSSCIYSVCQSWIYIAHKRKAFNALSTLEPVGGLRSITQQSKLIT